MNDLPIQNQLQNLANKLRQMWGNNPDSNLIEEAAKLLTPEEAKVSPEKVPAPVKGKKTTTKDA